MKMTFQHTTRLDGQPCDDCGETIVEVGYWNWRPHAIVRRLCEDCYAKRCDRSSSLPTNLDTPD